jgi:pSer/pThr/pTyr-binding forkhead associated (FHA) protein
MTKDSERTIRTDQTKVEANINGKTGFSRTQKLPRKTFVGKIPTTQHAFLKILQETKKEFNLNEDEVVIGRIPECQVQLIVDNVSRKHARIIYRNEEYQLEDLGSTNGIYVNGIKVAKCILRDQDLLEIGGVKILFCEEKVRHHS